MRALYFDPAIPTRDLLNRMREIRPDITRQQLDDWINNMQNLVLRGVYELPRVGNITEDRLFGRVKAVDPRITRERFDAYIANRRAENREV